MIIFIGGDILKIIKSVLFYLWQFTYGILQNLIGLGMLAVYKAKGAKSEWFHNALITYIDRKNFGGVSLGMFIFVNAKRKGDDLHDLKIHEYGHTVQTMILGPLWLLVIAVPSFIWCGVPAFVKMRKEKNISYYWLYCEGWSNLCGLWATKDRFLTEDYINRGRYGKPINPNRSKRKDIKGRKRNK